MEGTIMAEVIVKYGPNERHTVHFREAGGRLFGKYPSEVCWSEREKDPQDAGQCATIDNLLALLEQYKRTAAEDTE
jgi:hypothetical protein